MRFRRLESLRQETAQESFQTMVRDRIAPALRELGFSGSGQSFALPSGSHWAILGLQKSRRSDRSFVEFTVNLTVVPRRVWSELAAEQSWLPERPSANTRYGGDARLWEARIGSLLPAKKDLWWRLRAGESSETVAAAVVEAIREFGLPAMRARVS